MMDDKFEMNVASALLRAYSYAVNIVISEVANSSGVSSINLEDDCEINLGLYNIHCSCIKAALIDEDVVFVYDGISTMYTNKELTQYKIEKVFNRNHLSVVIQPLIEPDVSLTISIVINSFEPLEYGCLRAALDEMRHKEQPIHDFYNALVMHVALINYFQDLQSSFSSDTSQLCNRIFCHSFARVKVQRSRTNIQSETLLLTFRDDQTTVELVRLIHALIKSCSNQADSASSLLQCFGVRIQPKPLLLWLKKTSNELKEELGDSYDSCSSQKLPDKFTSSWLSLPTSDAHTLNNTDNI